MASKWNFVLLVGLALMNDLCYIEAVKILMIPANMKSHVIYFTRLGQHLTQLGHDVEMLVPSNQRSSKDVGSDRFIVTEYQVDGDIPFYSGREASENLLRMAISKSQWEKLYLQYTFGKEGTAALRKDCQRLLENQVLMNVLKNSGFQIAIMDLIEPHCYFLVPHSMGIPHAILSLPIIPWAYRVPYLPVFGSILASSFSDGLTFSQRLSAFLHEIVAIKFNSQTKPNLADVYFGNNPNISLTGDYELLLNSSLWMYIEDISIGRPSPLMPNTVNIGDIMARPQEKEIPEHVEAFLNESPDGAILVSFGSYFDYVPDYLAQGFCEVFSQLKYHVIWKLNNDSICQNAKNVKILPWIPQNDLLAHPKIRLFITHGGFNSLIESVYHAKPVIVFPITFDQPGNAEKVALKKFGIRIDIAEFSVESLFKNIELLLTNSSFTDNVKLASAILKDKQNSPAERVSYLINHVIKHGDKHLRTGAFKLSIFQFFMFDIFLFISLVLTILAVVMSCCCWHCCKFAGKKLFSSSTKLKSS